MTTMLAKKNNITHSLNPKIEITSIENSFNLDLFKEINDYLPVGIFISNKENQCIYCNKAFLKTTGLTLDEFSGKIWLNLIHPDDRARVSDAWKELEKHRGLLQVECRVLRTNGSSIWVKIQYAHMSGNGAFLGHMVVMENVEERIKIDCSLKRSRKDIYEKNEQAERTLNSMGTALVSTDIDGLVTFLNVAAEQMTGWESREALGRPLMEIVHIVDNSSGKEIFNLAFHAMKENKTVSFYSECSLVRKDGRLLQIEDTAAPIHNSAGNVTGAVIVFHDVSMLQAEVNKMSHLAKYDLLTDLPNRILLEERCMQTIMKARQTQQPFALIFIDIDNFKEINDSMGHMMGDYCLQSIANRLSKCTRITDTVCRHGGDEFVVLLSDIAHKNDALSVANVIKEAFMPPHHVNGLSLNLSISMGVSIYPNDGEDIHSLMIAADKAMYSAKKRGKSEYSFCS